MRNPVLLDSGLPGGTTRVNRIRTGSGHAFLECRTDGGDSGLTSLANAAVHVVGSGGYRFESRRP